MKNGKKLIYGCIIFVILAGAVYQFSKKSTEGLVLSEDIVVSDWNQEITSGDHIKVSDEGNIIEQVQSDVPAGCCYVCGAVKKPGVYDFIQGDRVHDLIEKAGGLKNDAVPESLNLAQLVSDGEKIYVPSVGEEESQEDFSSAYTTDSRDTGTGQKVNLNTANAETLKTLPGVGDTKAERIVTYREEHGGFQNIEEIKNVEGIKDGMFQKIKDLITV